MHPCRRPGGGGGGGGEGSGAGEKEEEMGGRGKRKVVVYLCVNGRRCGRRPLVYQWLSFTTPVIGNF